MLITPSETGIVVDLGDGRPSIPLSWRWLRDHGEDEASRDPYTLQRLVDSFAIDPNDAGDVNLGDGRLTITWGDGTVTLHTHEEIAAVVGDYAATDWAMVTTLTPRISDEAVLWPDPTAVAPQDVDLHGFLSDDSTLAFGVDQLCRYGYLVLRGEEISPDENGEYDKARGKAFVERLGYVRHTIFGGMWDLTPDLEDHADSAYSSVYIGPHTDGTYSHDAPGLQFFLALKTAATGGESLLVDGFAIAADLAASEPDVFADLASIPISGRYIEPGVSLRAERPVFRSTPRGLLDQVSFNNYDRAPFLLPPELEQRFYHAYGRFSELANDPARRAVVTLSAGDILIFDNWRSMHGRNAFTGYRHYFGAYLNHEDLESKRRILSLA